MRKGNAVDPLERMANTVELIAKLKLEEMKGNRNQREMIRLLAGLGASGSEIVSLLGASPATVHPEVSRMKAKGTGPRRSKERR